MASLPVTGLAIRSRLRRHAYAGCWIAEVCVLRLWHGKSPNVPQLHRLQGSCMTSIGEFAHPSRPAVLPPQHALHGGLESAALPTHLGRWSHHGPGCRLQPAWPEMPKTLPPAVQAIHPETKQARSGHVAICARVHVILLGRCCKLCDWDCRWHTTMLSGCLPRSQMVAGKAALSRVQCNLR